MIDPIKKKKFKSFIFHNRNFLEHDLIQQIEDFNNSKDDFTYGNRLFFEIYNSNKIEGNSLSRIDTKLLLEDKIMPEHGKYSDVIESLNLRRALNKFRKINTLSLELIMDIHNTITEDLLSSNELGKLRDKKVYITNSLHTPPVPEEVPNKLLTIINEYNSSNRTLRDMFMFKLRFVEIHPFIDGNGRTSRLILNGLLENQGFPRIVFRDSDKKFYYTYIEDAIVKYKIDDWIRYCILQLKFILENLNDPTILE
jgi:Fic family protein